MPVDEKDEEWLNLCKLAAKERDPKQLRTMIAEITRLLAAREQRRNGNSSSTHAEIGTPDE